MGAAYTRTSDWSTGYTAQYVVTNGTGSAKADWTLTFDLPSGAELSSLWNAESTVSGSCVTVKPAADATCSSIDQEKNAFTKAFAACKEPKDRDAAPPQGAASRRPPRQADSTPGSVPVRAACPYHRALDFGVRSSVV